MKGDFTRVTFDPVNHFSRVLMQQGRVQLDADFNEQAAILLHYIRRLASDLIGPYGGPGGESINFHIYKEGAGNNYFVGKGRYYVDGILVENDEDKSIELPADQTQPYILYLDAWERHLTYVQNDHEPARFPPIREVALGGPDTCTRAQVVWQVRCQEMDGSTADCSSAKDRVEDKRQEEALERRPRMRARVSVDGQGADACSIPPESRYRGLENHLYRIEVHRGGAAWQQAIQETLGNLSDAATIKWSRDNGSVIFPILKASDDRIFLEHLGHDQRTGLQIDDWVEIIDDDMELNGDPGILAQVKAIDTEQMSVTITRAADEARPWDSDYEKSPHHPLLRRWDHRQVEGLAMHAGAILVPSDGDVWIKLEDGIEVAFPPSDVDDTDLHFRTGDYWLVPARVATGDIEWPRGADDGPVARPPAGIVHHYAPLALIPPHNEPMDCRCKLSTLLTFNLES